MVWHSVVLPGTQTVTLVKSVLTLPPVAVGPPSTTTAATLGAAVTGEAEDPEPSFVRQAAGAPAVPGFQVAAENDRLRVLVLEGEANRKCF